MLNISAAEPVRFRHAINKAFEHFRQRHTREDIQRAYLKAKIDAETVSDQKLVFLGMVSHEIRSPLQNILGFTQLLSETALNEEQSEYTAFVARNAQTILDLSNDLLDFAKADQGTIALSSEQFTLEDWLNDCLSLLDERIHEKQIALNTHLPRSAPDFIRGDRLRLIQVLKNLLDNAVKFTPPSGNIDVDIDWLDASDSKGQLICRVKDSGCGIPASRLQHLFKPFKQASPTKDQRMGGTGLGLALCSQLCELMQGEIEVIDSSETGTTIQFQVILDSSEETERAPSVTKQPQPTPTPIHTQRENRVLVGDETLVSSKFLVRFFNHHSMPVETTALLSDLPRTYVPGYHTILILTDELGYEELLNCLKGIRSKENKDHTITATLVVVTRRCEANQIDAITASGADHIWEKPLTVERIKSLMLRSQSQDKRASAR